MKYDASIIQIYAQALYNEADQIVFRTALSYLLVGFFIGSVPALGLTLKFDALFVGAVIVIVCSALAALAGYEEGKRRSFRLRLEAQTHLCLHEIERHLRTPAAGEIAAFQHGGSAAAVHAR